MAFFKKNNQPPAFTLAEVLLVLVILGVIAAITMPTLNLSGNKEKALQVKALKVLGDIDKAFDLIKFNDSGGDLFTIYDPYNSSGTIFISNPADKDKFKAVLAKYLKITNKPCTDANKCFCATTLDYQGLAFYLNNGACVGFVMSNVGSSSFVLPDSGICNYHVYADAGLFLDINGEDGPNQMGTDRFKIPINQYGIDYSCRRCDTDAGLCAECAPDNPHFCTRCFKYSFHPGDKVVKPMECTINNGVCDCDYKEE